MNGSMRPSGDPGVRSGPDRGSNVDIGTGDARGERLPNIHPGEILKLDFLEPMGITPYKLAKDLGLSQSHVAELIKGERNVTALTAAMLAAYFGTSARLWTGLQTQYDLEEVILKHAEKLSRIKSKAPNGMDDKSNLSRNNASLAAV